HQRPGTEHIEHRVVRPPDRQAQPEGAVSHVDVQSLQSLGGEEHFTRPVRVRLDAGKAGDLTGHKLQTTRLLTGAGCGRHATPRGSSKTGPRSLRRCTCGLRTTLRPRYAAVVVRCAVSSVRLTVCSSSPLSNGLRTNAAPSSSRPSCAIASGL